MRWTAQCIIETVVEDDSPGTECLLSSSEFQPSNFSKTAKDIKLRILANFINVCHRICFYFILSYQMQASALIRRSFVENILQAISIKRFKNLWFRSSVSEHVHLESLLLITLTFSPSPAGWAVPVGAILYSAFSSDLHLFEGGWEGECYIIHISCLPTSSRPCFTSYMFKHAIIICVWFVD